MQPMSEPKDKRISVDLRDDELATHVENLADRLHVAKGTVGYFALRYIVPRVISGALAVVNGELIEVNPKRKAA